MKRSALKVVVVALLAVGAMIAVAGTVDDLQSGGGTADVPAQTETPDETRTTTAATTGTSTTEQTTVDPSKTPAQDCIDELRHPLVVLGILTMWVGIVYGVHRRHGTVEASAVFMLLFVLVFMMYPALAICGTPTERPQQDGGGDEPVIPNDSNDSAGVGDGTGDGDGTTQTVPDVPIAILAILAILAAAAVGGVLVRRDATDDEDPFESTAADPEDEASTVDVNALGDAAGRAAERIERTDDLDNEIYRAWVEMTTHLDVEHPSSSTPGEFATAARAAGVAEDDVAELTELFERVRYGHEAVTPERERRAVEALRRIDAQYGGADG